MENVAPSIKHIDFLGYVDSELGIFLFHFLHDLCFSIVSEFKNKGKICNKKIRVCVCVCETSAGINLPFEA